VRVLFCVSGRRQNVVTHCRSEIISILSNQIIKLTTLVDSDFYQQGLIAFNALLQQSESSGRSGVIIVVSLLKFIHFIQWLN